MSRVIIEQESGDAKLRVLESKVGPIVDKTVSEQRLDFAKFMKNYHSPNQEYGDVRVDVDEKGNHDLKEIQKNCSEVPFVGNDGDHFQKTLNSECKKATLLDHLMELRTELDARVAELSQFRAELREVSQLLSVDPFTSTKEAARAESSSSSVPVVPQATALQNAHSCEALDSQASRL